MMVVTILCSVIMMMTMIPDDWVMVVHAFSLTTVPTTMMPRSQHCHHHTLFGVRSELRKRFSSSVQHLVHSFHRRRHRRHRHDRDDEDDSDTTTITIEPNITIVVQANHHPNNHVPWNTTTMDDDDDVTTPTTSTTTTRTGPSSSRPDGLRLHLDELPLTRTTTSTNTTTTTTNNLELLSHAKQAASVESQRQPLYQVPHPSTFPNYSPDTPLTPLALEFRNMMEHFANYRQADVLALADPRKRALFEGIAASSYARPVYRAFEILYEDLLPLRYAGRLIYPKLQAFLQASVQQREEEMQVILNATGISSANEDDIQRILEIRLMFVTTASLLNGDSYLTLDQLAETGIISTTATEVLGLDHVDDVLSRLDVSGTGRITFCNLLLGLWELSNDYCGLELCNPQVVLHNLLVELNEHPPPMNTTNDLVARLDSNRQRYSQRYDEMVASFVQWKDLLPENKDGLPESRRVQVVRGCFAGAEIPPVVDALRVVYVDYAALRVAGDIIYKLTATIINNRSKR